VSPAKWQVYWLHQSRSRSATDPSQPNDASKPKRMYLVVGQTNPNSNVTCVPILSKVSGRTLRLTEVELPQSSYSKLSNDSVVACHEIVTVPSMCFSSTMEIALIPAQRRKVETALRLHLGL
jgi:mRNA-degrading endonuclease toxin of MazEF toxin-antitoxin module